MKLDITIEEQDILIKALRVRELVLTQCENDGYDVAHELQLTSALLATIVDGDDSDDNEALLTGWKEDIKNDVYHYNLNNGGRLLVTYDDGAKSWCADAINRQGVTLVSKSLLDSRQDATRWCETRWGQLHTGVWL